MAPLRRSEKITAMRAIAWRADVSPWGVDTAFSRSCDAVLKSEAPRNAPPAGNRDGALGLPDPFRSDREVLFPVVEAFAEAGEPAGLREPRGAEVVVFVHRGPYGQIARTYEKVLDWLRENRYEVAGAPREFVIVAPEPHGERTREGMLTEIEVPIREAS